MNSRPLLDESIQVFFSHLNWDNLPLDPSLAVEPMEFISVQAFFARIPWSGDPVGLTARSLASSTAVSAMIQPEEDPHFTLSDLFSSF